MAELQQPENEFTKSMYELRNDTAALFGKHLVIEGKDYYFKHAHKTLIAKYQASADSDGQDVKVFCTAYPATFYEIEVAPRGANSGFVLVTGSGMDKLAAGIAEAVSTGMMGFKSEAQNG
jgi:hypothetical protein